ncbi:unnamed protein product [Pedinophyceae sp. YPF-701]|nr:unnamed protein product [Pedinophyceae sp. YPF-701]
MDSVALFATGGNAWAAGALRHGISLAAVVLMASALCVLADKCLTFAKFAYLRLRRVAPEARYNFYALPSPVDFPGEFPAVAVQLPMFNETAVCEDAIACACSMEWPPSRLIVQVLDDSTDAQTRRLVDEAASYWRGKGIQCEVLRRQDRKGYKAGALKEGLELLRHVEYIAVFDADFRPEPSFLAQLVPYLHANPALGYVQARWTFVNAEESYLTRVQEVALNFHMKCEQYSNCAGRSFFNFNGTAGVWRHSCIHDVGGWSGRTTVEDMDLSLRAYLAGWEALFLADVECPSELPSCLSAYRKQQHRWTAGPAQLMKATAGPIWRSRLPLLRKLELIVVFFGVRKVLTHVASLGFFCMMVPLSMLVPSLVAPLWLVLHLPLCVTLLVASLSRRGWANAVTYVLYENAMGVVKAWALLSGLLNLKRATEWVVTQKTGAGHGEPGAPLQHANWSLHPAELLMSAFMIGSAGTALVLSHGTTVSICVFVCLQGLAFLAFGSSMVDANGLLGRSRLHKLQAKQQRVTAQVGAQAAAIAAPHDGPELAHSASSSTLAISQAGRRSSSFGLEPPILTVSTMPYSSPKRDASADAYDDPEVDLAQLSPARAKASHAALRPSLWSSANGRPRVSAGVAQFAGASAGRTTRIW